MTGRRRRNPGRRVPGGQDCCRTPTPVCEHGVGPISTVFGVAILLGFLFLATQTFVHLYATSTVTAAAFDAAKRVAAEDGGGCDAAPERVQALLGDYGSRPEVAVTCVDDGDQLSVTVRGPTPARLVDAFGTRLFDGGIERTATVRIERLR